MSLQEMIGIFMRQTTVALSCFTAFCIIAETIFPGFATPFAHIALLGLVSILLAWFSPVPTERVSHWARIRALCVWGLVVMGGIGFLLTQLAPLGMMAWIRLIGIGLTGAFVAGYLYQQTSLE